MFDLKKLLATVVYFIRYKILKINTYELDNIEDVIAKIQNSNDGHLIIDIRNGLFVDVQIISYTILTHDYPVLSDSKTGLYITVNFDDSMKEDVNRIQLYDQVLVKEYPILVRSVQDGIYTYILQYESSILKRILMEIFKYKNETKVIVEKLKLTGYYPQVDKEIKR